MEPLKQRIATILISYPKSLLISLFLLSIIAIYPASKIQTNFNLEEFFPKDDVTLLAYQKTAELFGRDDNTFLVAIRLQDSVYHKLNEIKLVQYNLSQHPKINSVQSVWDLAYIKADENEFTAIEPLRTEPLPLAIQHINSTSYLRNTLISADTSLTLLLVSVPQEFNTYTNRTEIIDFINHTIRHYSISNSYFISGIPHFRTKYVDFLNREIALYIGLGSILIIGLLWMLYRNIRDVILPILIVWLTILFTVAIMSMTGGFFEIMSSTIAPILLCVGIGDSVHLLTKYNDSVFAGINRRNSLIETIRTLGLATLLTSITTAIGFATLLVSNVLPMQRFGLYTAIGVMVAFVATILFLPSFIWQFKRKQTRSYDKAFFDNVIDNFLQRLSLTIQNRYKAIVIGGILIGLGIGSGSLLLKINSKVFDDIGENSELIQHIREIGNTLTAPVQMDIVLDTGSPEGIFSSDVHRVLHDVEQRLSEFPQIKQVRSVVPIIQHMHTDLTAQSSPYFDSDSLNAANYLFLLELSSSQTFSAFADFTYQYIRISTFLDDIGSAEVNVLRDDLTRLFQTDFPDYTFSLTGSGVLVADLAYNLVYSLNSSIILALLFIGLIMFIMFKTPSLIVTSLLPNVLPLLLTAGIMGFFNIPLKPSTAVIFTITFGIAVDDSIHFLARYRIERKKNEREFYAIFTTVQRTGKAIILTSLILLAGFGVLITSQFDSTLLMGALTCFTIIIALIYDLLFLPALLYWKLKSEETKQKNVQTTNV